MPAKGVSLSISCILCSPEEMEVTVFISRVATWGRLEEGRLITREVARVVRRMIRRVVGSIFVVVYISLE